MPANATCSHFITISNHPSRQDRPRQRTRSAHQTNRMWPPYLSVIAESGCGAARKTTHADCPLVLPTHPVRTTACAAWSSSQGCGSSSRTRGGYLDFIALQASARLIGRDPARIALGPPGDRRPPRPALRPAGRQSRPTHRDRPGRPRDHLIEIKGLVRPLAGVRSLTLLRRWETTVRGPSDRRGSRHLITMSIQVTS